jgi:hypothetical protein
MHFHPLHFGWVALPPKPKAVVVFIGGAFFGTFPTFFYRGFLRKLYDLDYAVVALPFRFTFNHWDIALSVSIYLVELRHELDTLLLASISDGGKQNVNPIPKIPYLWIAHSLGCKYVALLELLTEREKSCTEQRIMEALQEVAPKQAEQLQAKLNLIEADQISLLNQPQILVDPVITNLEAAIPWEPLEKIFAPLLKVVPSRDTTFKLIDGSPLFSLTKILSLTSKTAADTIYQLQHVVRKPSQRPIDICCADLYNEKPFLGRHLAILGLQSTDRGIADAITTNVDIAYQEAQRYQSDKTK